MRSLRLHTLSWLNAKRTSGFTLVELMVILVVIGILVSIVSIGLTRYLKDGRDAERNADMVAISNTLERYFDESGEYPACSTLQGSTATVQTALPKLTVDSIVSPNATNKANSSFVCTSLSSQSTTDAYAYVGTGCNAEACNQWTLQYREEGTGQIISMTSLRIASGGGAPEPPTPPSGDIIYTLEEIEDFCSSTSNAPAGYNVIMSAGGGATTYGTSGNDMIYGGPGINIIYAGAGSDIFCGASAADQLYGEDGVDYILGSSGIDILSGGPGNDLIAGGSGSDTIYGNDGDDILYGETGSDTIDGGLGNDMGNDPSGGDFISIETIF